MSKEIVFSLCIGETMYCHFAFNAMLIYSIINYFMLVTFPVIEYLLKPLVLFPSGCLIWISMWLCSLLFDSFFLLQIQASSVISLLQSDIKLALKTAFGNLDGPLSAIDWCRGRGQSGDSKATGDGYSFQCTASEAKDSSSSVTLVGEPISPPQSTGGSSCIRGISCCPYRIYGILPSQHDN